MVKFGDYFKSMVALKPEWAPAFVDYIMLKKLTAQLKNEALSKGVATVEHFYSERKIVEERDGFEDDEEKPGSLAGTQRLGDTRRSSDKHLQRNSSLAEVVNWRLRITSKPSSDDTATLWLHNLEHIRRMAMDFEESLLEEIGKASKFAEKSIDSFVTFFEENKPKWKDKNHSRSQTKDSMKYLQQEVDHLISFCETCELAAHKLMKHYVQLAPYVINEELLNSEVALRRLTSVKTALGELSDAIAAVWAKLFSEHDINAAKKHMRKAYLLGSVSQGFRTGFFVAMIAATILYTCHVVFELEPDQSVQDDFFHAFDAFRLFFALNLSFICWSFVLLAFSRLQVNFLFIMDLSRSLSSTWLQVLEIGTFNMWLFITFVVLFVRSKVTVVQTPCTKPFDKRFPYLEQYFLPVYCALFAAFLAYPIRHVFRKTRNAFFKTLWRCLKLPFGSDVRFADFLLAEWATSYVVTAGDFCYLLCYYFADAGECHRVKYRYSIPISALPFFWRACQTYKKYMATDNKLHRINFSKYVTCLLYMACMWWHAMAPNSTVAIVFLWLAFFVSQTFYVVWEVLVDWGWMLGKRKQKLVHSMRAHVAAIVFNIIARILCLPTPLFVSAEWQTHWVHLGQVVVEVIRRGVWTVFRLANEQMNNMENYRTIDFIPQAVLRKEE